MHSLPTHFDLLKSRIEPDPKRAETAADIPAAVRDHLKVHTSLTTVAPHTRLAGSYGRSTAILQIKDVDILVFVNPEWQDTGIRLLLTTLAEALQELPEELGDACGEVTLRHQRRSINVYLPEHDLALDIVPVLLTASGVTDVLKVPDREWQKWVKTQPLGYADFLSTLNAAHNGKIVPLIKMVKLWRETWFTRRRPKSYWLESLVVQHLRDGDIPTAGRGDAEILADLFSSIHTAFAPLLDQAEKTPTIPDAMLDNNVAWNWERSHVETFMRRLDDTCGWTRRAVETEDKETAIALWQKVFGAKRFPSTTDVEEDAQQKAALAAAGSLRMAAKGRILSGASQATPAIAVPSTRFFGEE